MGKQDLSIFYRQRKITRWYRLSGICYFYLRYPDMKRIELFLLLSFVCTAIYAQQPLNADFEKISPEGFTRPWGWSNDLYSANTGVRMDSLQKHGGKYSLLMKGTEENAVSSFQSLVLSVEPYTLKNKKVKIEAWIKTEDLKGAAFFACYYAFDSKGTLIGRTDTVKTKIAGTTNWQKISLSLSLPAALSNFSILLFQSGKGNAWFDDLGLSIDGKVVKEVQIAKAISVEQVKWLSQQASAIHSVNAVAPGIKSSNADLKTFGEIAGNAQIIALGESTHGTGEFFRMKNRALEYAVTELGVRIFGLEDNQLIVERVNKYVLGGKGTARSSMYGLFSVWQNQEMLDLIKWVRSYNELHPGDKVEFLGFDMQNPAQAYDSLSVFLTRNDPASVPKVNEWLAALKKNGANSYNFSDSIKLSWAQNAEKVFDLVVSQKQAWLAAAKNKSDSLNVEWGMQYATLVKQYAENTYKGHMSLYRDVAMAENVSWILSMHKPGTRMLLWAHDNHISKGEDPVAENNYYHGISMGAHLTKKYGSSYKAFGQFTYSGNYLAQISYFNFDQISCPLLPGPKGSLDEALHQVSVQKKAGTLLLDLREARKMNWFVQALPVRFANHVSSEYSYWTRFSIPYQFDGLFFMDTTSAARPCKE
jgi:erythromycin esterase